MAVDLNCDGSGGGEHATKLNTSFLHRGKEKRECQIFPRSRQGCSPTSNIFPSRPLSRSAAFRVNTKTSEWIDHNQPLRPPLPNNSFNYRVGGTGVRAMSGRNVLAVALGTYACFALSNWRGRHFHDRSNKMFACSPLPLFGGVVALSPACF